MRYLLFTLLSLLSISSLLAESFHEKALQKYQSKEYSAAVDICKDAILEEELDYNQLVWAFDFLQAIRLQQGLKNTSEIDTLIKAFLKKNISRPTQLVHLAKLYNNIIPYAYIVRDDIKFHRVYSSRNIYLKTDSWSKTLELQETKKLLTSTNDLNHFFSNEMKKLKKIKSSYASSEVPAHLVKFTTKARSSEYKYNYKTRKTAAIELMLSIKKKIPKLSQKEQAYYWLNLAEFFAPQNYSYGNYCSDEDDFDDDFDEESLEEFEDGFDEAEEFFELPEPNSNERKESVSVYTTPRTLEAAKSDLEKWKFCLSQLAKISPKYQEKAVFIEANFLAKANHDLRDYNNYHNDWDSYPNQKHKVRETIESLSDDEIYLAGKVEKLLDSRNYIKMLKTLVEKKHLKAHWLLAKIYVNRGQRHKAVELYQKSLEIQDYPAVHIILKHLTKNWGSFTYADANLKDNKIGFSYRNSPSVKVKIHNIDSAKLFAHIQSHYNNKLGTKQSIPYDFTLLRYDKRVDPVSKVDFLKKFIIKSEEKIHLFKSTEKYTDQYEKIDLGLKDGQTYLLEAEVPNGNKTTAYVYIPKNAIAVKRLNSGLMIYVCDRQTGDIVPNADINLWAYTLDYSSDFQRDRRINFDEKFKKDKGHINPMYVFSQNYKFKTSNKGLAFVPNRYLKSLKKHTLFISAQNDKYFDFLTVDKENVKVINSNNYFDDGSGFDSFGDDFSDFDEDVEESSDDFKAENPQKEFIIIDKPIYKPGETVHFKVAFNKNNLKQTKGQKPSYKVQIRNRSKYKLVFDKDFPLTNKPSISGSYTIPKNANLGRYSINNLNFYIEEYRAPKFSSQVRLVTDNRKDKQSLSLEITASYPDGKKVSGISGHASFSFYLNDDKGYVKEDKWKFLYGPKYGRSFQDYSSIANTPHFRQSPFSNKYLGLNANETFYQSYGKNSPSLELDSIKLNFDKNGIAKLELDTKELKSLNSLILKSSVKLEDSLGNVHNGSSSIEVPSATELYDIRTDKNFYFAGEAIKLSLDSSFKHDTEKTFSLRSKNHIEQITLKSNSTITLQDLPAGHYSIEDKLSFIVLDKNNSLPDTEQALSVITEKQTYASFSDEPAKVLVSSKYKDAKVLLISKPNSEAKHIPFSILESPAFVHLLELKGHSKLLEVDLGYLPNQHLVAIMVKDKEFHEVSFNIPVLPSDELKLDVTANKEKFKPGETAEVKIKINSFAKKPVIALTVYDQNLEHIGSPLTTSPSIFKHFWSWLRTYNKSSSTNAIVQPMWINSFEKGVMTSLGLFNNLLIPRIVKRAPHNASSKKQFFFWEPHYNFSFDDFEDDFEDDFGSDEDFGELEEGGPRSIAKTSLAQKFNSYIRAKFNDSVYWNANIIPDKNGEATISVKLPDTLSTWKIKAWIVDGALACGETEKTIVTTKELSLRTNPPRFLVETDEIIYTAKINNSLDKEQTVTTVIKASEELSLAHSTPVEQKLTIPAKSEATMTWKLKALKEGSATVTLFSQGKNESDAIKETIPVKIYGILKQESFVGNTEVNHSFNVEVPNETKFDITVNPSIASSLIESLPYLISYPHGCAEQTLNRFLPCLLFKQFSEQKEIDISKLKAKNENHDIAFEFFDSPLDKKRPVFDKKTLDDMTKKGIKKLLKMQNRRGGWPWFDGGKSSPYITALVLDGLMKVDNPNRDLEYVNRFEDALEYLMDIVYRHKNGDYLIPDLTAQNLYIYYVIADKENINNSKLNEAFFKIRNEMSTYSRCMMALAFLKLNEQTKAQTIFKELKQQLVINKELKQAHLHVEKADYWRWYNDDIETQACFLKLLCAINDQSNLAEQVTQYLLNKRELSGHWPSTRNTALAIEAILEYLKFKKEKLADKSVDLIINGEHKKKLKFNQKNWLSQSLSINDLPVGTHKIEFKSNSKAYFTASLSYFSKEKQITPAGLDIKVERQYFRVKTNNKEKETLELIKEGEELESGDLVEVQIKITAANDYEYILVSDPKVASFEAVEQKSGYRQGHYREYRNASVNCYFEYLNRGERLIKYRVRTTNKGKFNALPTQVEAMYTPRIKANSENKLFKVSE